MTVTVTNTFSGPFLPNGATLAFPFTFKAASASEVSVEIDGVVQGGYTVALQPTVGGTVTFAVPPTGSALYIYSQPTFRQDSTFEVEGAFRPDVFNSIFDRLAIGSAWLKARVEKLLPNAGILGGSTLAGKFLTWDAGGNPIFTTGTGVDSAFRSDAGASTGSSLVGFLQSGTGAVARTAQAKLREVISASDFGFGKTGNTSAQNATALQAAITYQQSNGGALHIPNTTGVFTDPISVVLGGVPLVMIGEGQASSILRKPSNDANPVLTISSTGTLYPYCYFNGIRFDNGLRGTRAGIGVKLIDVPTFVFDRCVFEGCATGVLGQGALIGTFVDCSVLNCDVGYDFTRSAASIYANLLNIERGEIKGNTIGLRFDYGAQLRVNRADIEANGITGNTATGAVFLGSNLSTEAGYSQVYINAWFEANKGVTVKGATPGANCVLTIDQSWFVGNEAATEVQLSGWKAIKLSGVVAPTGTWTTQAADFDSDITSIINTLVDTSTSGPTNLRTATQRYQNSMDLARIRTKAYTLSTQDLLMASDDQILGGPTKDVGLAKYGDGEFYLGTTAAKRVRINTTGLGFFGTAPVARGALATNATDLATAITLVNDIKAKLIALGLTA